MPTVAVDKLDLFDRLGRSYSMLQVIEKSLETDYPVAKEEFDHLCFEFGLELDEYEDEVSKRSLNQ